MNKGRAYFFDNSYIPHADGEINSGFIKSDFTTEAVLQMLKDHGYKEGENLFVFRGDDLYYFNEMDYDILNKLNKFDEVYLYNTVILDENELEGTGLSKMPEGLLDKSTRISTYAGFDKDQIRHYARLEDISHEELGKRLADFDKMVQTLENNFDTIDKDIDAYDCISVDRLEKYNAVKKSIFENNKENKLYLIKFNDGKHEEYSEFEKRAIIDVLLEAGYKEGENLIILNPQDNVFWHELDKDIFEKIKEYDAVYSYGMFGTPPLENIKMFEQEASLYDRYFDYFATTHDIYPLEAEIIRDQIDDAHRAFNKVVYEDKIKDIMLQEYGLVNSSKSKTAAENVVKHWDENNYNQKEKELFVEALKELTKELEEHMNNKNKEYQILIDLDQKLKDLDVDCSDKEEHSELDKEDR